MPSIQELPVVSGIATAHVEGDSIVLTGFAWSGGTIDHSHSHRQCVRACIDSEQQLLLLLLLFARVQADVR